MLATDTFTDDFSCNTCGKIITSLTSPSHCPHCGKGAPDHGFPTAEAVKIAAQNDRFRAGLLDGKASDLRGQLVVTAAVNALGWDFITDATIAVAKDTDFTADNDPYGDHTFGTVTVRGVKLFWKIDLYDNDLTFGSPAPAEPSETRRVLTVMLPSDY